MKFKAGDLVKQNSNGVLWIVFKVEKCTYSYLDYSVTLRRATWTKYGHGGSRVCSPSYYTLVQRADRRQYE